MPHTVANVRVPFISQISLLYISIFAKENGYRNNRFLFGFNDTFERYHQSKSDGRIPCNFSVFLHTLCYKVPLSHHHCVGMAQCSSTKNKYLL